MPSCPIVNGESPDVTGVDKHVCMPYGASFASVPTHVHHIYLKQIVDYNLSLKMILQKCPKFQKFEGN